MEKDQAWKGLAEFLKSHAETISEEWESAFVAEYPRARANVLETEAIHRWTQATVQEIISCLEQGDASTFTYLDHIADVLLDPYETELTLFASNLSNILFLSRHIAPMIIVETYTDARHGRELIDALETFVQEVIAANCDMFKAETGTPHAISRGWRLLNSTGFHSVADDSPAKRRMSRERYSRIMRSSETTPKPGGDELTEREREVLVNIMDGRSNAEIAKLMGIAETTVKKHVSHIFDKYGVYSRAELMASVRSGRG